ncbi:hypothetical protein BH09BAC2_BH09BAC2_15220 [soil metagenome]
MALKIDKTPEPFFATVFSLSSHHPFSIPKQFKDRFKQEGHPVLSTIEYTDFALSQFFNSLKKTSAFQHTLFVITADHTGPAPDNSHRPVDDYRIPVIFYKPDNSLQGINHTIANQIDILPSLMHLLKYEKPFFSLGKDLFSDTCKKISINYLSGIYQYFDSTNCYQFNGDKGFALYNWKTDPEFKKNQITNPLYSNVVNSADESLKKSLQVFTECLIHNKMFVN